MHANRAFLCYQKHHKSAPLDLLLNLSRMTRALANDEYLDGRLGMSTCMRVQDGSPQASIIKDLICPAISTSRGPPNHRHIFTHALVEGVGQQIVRHLISEIANKHAVVACARRKGADDCKCRDCDDAETLWGRLIRYVPWGHSAMVLSSHT